jgi:hypothetical protein
VTEIPYYPLHAINAIFPEIKKNQETTKLKRIIVIMIFPKTKCIENNEIK